MLTANAEGWDGSKGGIGKVSTRRGGRCPRIDTGPQRSLASRDVCKKTSPGLGLSSARLSAGETISMLKSTEDGSAENIVTVYGLRTEVKLTAHPARPSRRIDVYGDSDSASKALFF